VVERIRSIKMPIQILMPSLSPTMESGKLSKWLKSEGDLIKNGDIIAEIETDKATMEIESVDEGVLNKILVSEGTEDVPVNEPIAILLEEGEKLPRKSPIYTDFKNDLSSKKPKKTEEFQTPQISEQKNNTESKNNLQERVFSSPLARRLAMQEGIDISNLTGTGPHSRIIKRDIETEIEKIAKKYNKGPLESGNISNLETVNESLTPVDNSTDLPFQDYEVAPKSSMRSTISKRMTKAARDVPHFNLESEIALDALLSIRESLNAIPSADFKISINDFIIKALALALMRNPKCNVNYIDGTIHLYKTANISIAIALENGLITPIVKEPAKKRLVEISEEVKSLIVKAQKGVLKPDEFIGGTFTISNLGMFGVKSFNSIINEPQGGILSVGCYEPRAIVKEKSLGIGQMMSLTIAFDHRCIDGAPAASLLRDLKEILENPVQLIL